MITLLLVLLLWGKDAPYAQNNPGDSRPLKEIRFAILNDIYTGVARQDARVALETIMQKVINQRSYPYRVSMNIMDQTSDVVHAIQQGGYHFVVLSGVDYHAYRTTLQLTPVLIPSKSEHPTDTLVFLVHKGRTLSSIARKEERVLIVEGGHNGILSQIWLDSELSARSFADTKTFFTRIRTVKKPDRAVLPVFFDQADASVVSLKALQVIQELNPQIRNRIYALFRSTGLVRQLICATPSTFPEEIEAFVTESLQIDSTPDTDQALTIIQTKRFHPVMHEGVEATVQLLSNHRTNH